MTINELKICELGKLRQMIRLRYACMKSPLLYQNSSSYELAEHSLLNIGNRAANSHCQLVPGVIIQSCIVLIISVLLKSNSKV